MKIISKAEAKAKGLKRYYTGVPCAKGHLSERLTGSYNCLQCSKESHDTWRAKDPKAKKRSNYLSRKRTDAHKKRVARWQHANLDKHRVHKKIHLEKKRGRLVPKPCTQCGSDKDLCAHHEDHSKPLEITWLCRPCHGRLHALRSGT
jgi:hypothetical protein